MSGPWRARQEANEAQTKMLNANKAQPSASFKPLGAAHASKALLERERLEAEQMPAKDKIRFTRACGAQRRLEGGHLGDTSMQEAAEKRSQGSRRCQRRRCALPGARSRRKKDRSHFRWQMRMWRDGAGEKEIGERMGQTALYAPRSLKQQHHNEPRARRRRFCSCGRNFRRAPRSSSREARVQSRSANFFARTRTRFEEGCLASSCSRQTRHR